MKLTSIKLSGFKSFVDPTTIEVKGQLVGVVGPNGCGKSNIIDAVRWVLGESRASELRGESMRDVIFNGTIERKPSGRASVELVFDNDEARVTGQWGRFEELAVRRVLTRDGGSSYHINNLNVRRRDIQDIFMGTGLGPRAYAIIGQGMIARIIEARPEELRVFLEEAAGVSRYRERRRETENRLQDTRENLTRIADILREINQSLVRLEEQAAVAEQFYALQKEQEKKQKLLWLLEKNNAEAEHARSSLQTEQAKTALEAMNAELLRHDSRLDELRAVHAVKSDELHLAQGRLYQTNATIGSLEAEIRFVIESRTRLQTQINSYSKQREEWQKQHEAYTAELEAARAELNERTLVTAERESSVETLNEQLLPLEEKCRILQVTCSRMHDAVLHVRQNIALSAARHKNASDRLLDIHVRKEKLGQEKVGLAEPDESAELVLVEEQAEKEMQLQEMHLRLESLQHQQPDLEENRRALQQAVENTPAGLAQIEARLTALIDLQHRSQVEGEVESWLQKYELTGLPVLWQQLKVESGWEMALESLLGDRMFAREIAQLGWTGSFVSDAPAARLTFFSREGREGYSEIVGGTGKWTALSTRVTVHDEKLKGMLEDWLSCVFIADDLQAALRDRHELPAGAVFILKEGHLVDRQSVRFYAPETLREGIFARQQEIDALIGIQGEEQDKLSLLREQLKQAERSLAECNRDIHEAHQAATRLTRDAHTLQLQILRLKEEKERFQARAGQIQSTLDELNAQEAEQRHSQAEEEAVLAEFDVELADLQTREEAEKESLGRAEAELEQLRKTIREGERAAQEAAFSERTLKSRLGELARHIETAEEQARQMSGNVDQGQLALQELDDRVAQENLQKLLEQRLGEEQALSQLRQQLDEISQQLRLAQEERLTAEKALQPQRDAIVQLQLKEQAARIQAEQFSEKLREVNADIAALSACLEPGMRTGALQAEVTRLSNAITSLGAVNLAAAGELSETRERRNFLEEQHADLTTAIETLEDAIRRIDRESRALLQGTFDLVNQHLSDIFPMLFGGGQASLIMTGDEILDAGVQIMVQPPGKKNVTIHLLSGGEKALAAIALVFSLFQLNPAPFCLLDEVDAPLDDANTERFCNMVKRMSAKTQFLFVSHNKIAMEMAQQLVGVTMQEQGVSRIVSVDIEKATELSNEVQTA